jgi:hypothetical protein
MSLQTAPANGQGIVTVKSRTIKLNLFHILTKPEVSTLPTPKLVLSNLSSMEKPLK